MLQVDGALWTSAKVAGSSTPYCLLSHRRSFSNIKFLVIKYRRTALDALPYASMQVFSSYRGLSGGRLCSRVEALRIRRETKSRFVLDLIKQVFYYRQ